jgi:hypothetical protein
MREALTEVFVFVKERVPEIVKKKISFKRIKNILLELGIYLFYKLKTKQKKARITTSRA